MIFKQYEQVLDGSKTQTRRPVKPLDIEQFYSWQKDGGIGAVLRKMGGFRKRTLWRVGDSYAVQPGRGKKAVGRIRIKKIRRERLQKISLDDVLAEGVKLQHILGDIHGQYSMKKLWDTIYKKPYRWEDNPEVWVLGFERVE